MINNQINRTNPPSDFTLMKEDIHNAIDAYAKLYLIHKELMSLSHTL